MAFREELVSLLIDKQLQSQDYFTQYLKYIAKPVVEDNLWRDHLVFNSPFYFSALIKQMYNVFKPANKVFTVCHIKQLPWVLIITVFLYFFNNL